ncbi:predicted protein [Scheffersomyces stipitis CBS 6054]|uniref:Uncharacterized protein n=1 Tax=Scheffersomyces stipitis (strain ATCC 58785 / CBS 6054 / NBRC 10063 / NRRL Y-11545) TaxID=322104 RepID=A3LYD3_PICST|nr:predicted protein [Scheffersomyces stipitis CBS 6054]ABN67963.1 predicted protein [Scheffersomyces stipitis CBS 6054]
MTTLGVTDVTCGSMFSCSDYKHPNTPNQENDMDEVDDIGSDFDIDIAKEETVSHTENLKRKMIWNKTVVDKLEEDISAKKAGPLNTSNWLTQRVYGKYGGENATLNLYDILKDLKQAT